MFLLLDNEQNAICKYNMAFSTLFSVFFLISSFNTCFLSSYVQGVVLNTEIVRFKNG